MSASAVSAREATANRWWQLALGLVVMMSISSPQYTWALFTGSLTKTYGVPLSTLQVTFSLLIVFQTFLSPFQAYLVDRFGARSLISLGAALLVSSIVGVLLTISAATLFGLRIVRRLQRLADNAREFELGDESALWGAAALMTGGTLLDVRQVIDV